MGTVLRLESMHGGEGVLSVRCTGTVGIGSASNASMHPVRDALAGWMREHEDETVREIVVDLTDVDYQWGDAPVSCFVPFVREGVKRIRFLAGPGSAPALESLVETANMPWFSVERTGT
jgi:hypothetical protein